MSNNGIRKKGLSTRHLIHTIHEQHVRVAIWRGGLGKVSRYYITIAARQCGRHGYGYDDLMTVIVALFAAHRYISNLVERDRLSSRSVYGAARIVP